MLALGADIKRDEYYARDMKIADEIANTCYLMYMQTPTGLSPETVTINNEGKILTEVRYNILRPEAIEGIYYMYYYTKDEKYREWGWEMFQGFDKYCRTEYGYASLHDVNDGNSINDKTESFWVAETLKYFYLLFNPSKIDMNKYVFTTEAHLLEIYG